MEKSDTDIAFEEYTYGDLKNSKEILVEIPTSKDILNKFVHINDDAIIEFISIEYENFIEAKYYFKEILKAMNILSKHNKKYNIKIVVDNRKAFKEVDLINKIPKNIKLIINSDYQEYDMDEYKKEEKTLDKLVEPIRDLNLSPFEKYLACYNIVKNFKPYKDNDQDKDKSRFLKYILENDYIVCVGFASLLQELLNRVGIPSFQTTADIDLSYEDGFTLSDTPIESSGHVRNIIKLDDEKYNIHGYYVVDATWDNDLEDDLYVNALLTFEQKKESLRLESLTDIDLLLDFNDFDDFNKKINYYIKSHISSEKEYLENHTFEEIMVEQYILLYMDIMSILSNTDIKKYCYFYNKYDDKLNYSLKELEPVMYKFLNEYANYIIPLSNNKVSFDKILSAATIVKKEVENYTEQELKEWYEECKDINLQIQKEEFPYN